MVTSAATAILFVIHGLGRAGPELRMLDFARGFPEGLEVHVCSIGDDLTLLNDLKKTRARILTVPIRRAYAEWRQVGKILAYIREHGISIVNSFDLKTLLVCLMAKFGSRRRVKVVHHVVSLWEDLHWRQHAMLRQAIQHADLVVCNGHAVKEQVIGSRRLGPKVSIIPNGVDGERYRATPELRLRERERYGFAPSHFVLGTVANVRPVKNYPFLLTAMRRVAQKYPQARLLCVGGGVQLDEMKALAQRLELGNAVIFTGSVADVRPYVATLDAFALCSRNEGCPNVVLQAMAMSVPVIASAVGEIPHMIEDGESGLLFEPENEDAFLGAVSRLVEDESYRGQLARVGRQRMEVKYSVGRMIDDYVALFHGLAHRRPSFPGRV
jgi:glycosyltransferase involved in cell wall biosynthesis